MMVGVDNFTIYRVRIVSAVAERLVYQVLLDIELGRDGPKAQIKNQKHTHIHTLTVQKKSTEDCTC